MTTKLKLHHLPLIDITWTLPKTKTNSWNY